MAKTREQSGDDRDKANAKRLGDWSKGVQRAADRSKREDEADRVSDAELRAQADRWRGFGRR
jgi:hypothetical protein